MPSDFDNPWKEALDRFLPAILAFFFPEVHAGIDWSRRYVSLDKELRKIRPEAETGKLFADMLFQVWRKDGQEAWVLIHIEVQSQHEERFPERNFIYYYRIFDQHRVPVVSLAILGDDRPGWRPNKFSLSLWGCSNTFEFPVVKLLDYAGQEDDLERDPSPCAAIVLAHLKTLATRDDPNSRHAWKLRLIKGLFDRGFSADDIRQLFRLIDWMMILPATLEIVFRDEIHRFEEERKMPYVTSIERLAMEEGEKKGLAEGEKKGLAEGEKKGLAEGEIRGLKLAIKTGLERRFGPEGLAFAAELDRVKDVNLLRSIHEKLWMASPMEEIRAVLRQG
jgi:hypothetical protein